VRQVFEHARELRARCIDAETKLWAHLRARRMPGTKFRRQFPIAGFIADFANPEVRLVVELDGGQHLEQAEYDAQRSQRLARQGYRIVRFWNDEVMTRLDDVLAEISKHILTPPQPSPAGRGGSPARQEPAT
jgi:very-short-patch-repair endonuclease